jgi:hypothetical protein
MKAIISADELAKDVAGAEALLERHQEHKVNLLIIIIIHLLVTVWLLVQLDRRCMHQQQNDGRCHSTNTMTETAYTGHVLHYAL